MINRTTSRIFTATLAAAALLLAAALPAAAAHALRGPGTGMVTIQQGHASPNYGYGYGRGWCYWHPYVCYRSR